MNPTLRIAAAVEFSAHTHADQRRKGPSARPYFNHLAKVAQLVTEATRGDDPDLTIAAYLHDCIEDQGVTEAEIAARFGDDVANLVAAVTDDKSLGKAERKSLVIAHAAHKSARAKLLKLADLVANLSDLLDHPPANWSVERVQGYFDWAAEVVDGLRSGTPALDAPDLLQTFDALHARRGEAKAGPVVHPLALAVKIAATAHTTHKPDKGGAPYILHPLRMMMRMDNDEARMAAVLHDVVEDHRDEGWTFERLAEEGIPAPVIEALRCVTKTDEEERDKEGMYLPFVRRAAANPVARAVKIADLEDNMTMTRIGTLRPKDLARLERYHQAWSLLTKGEGDV